MTDKPKYKAGDVVTVKLDEFDARRLNCGGPAGVTSKQIISHTPAPEPIVGYVVVDRAGFCGVFPSMKRTEQFHNGDYLVSIKLTYDPATGEASAEVVK